jgi:hypothetical protein
MDCKPGVIDDIVLHGGIFVSAKKVNEADLVITNNRLEDMCVKVHMVMLLPKEWIILNFITM